MSKNEPQGCLFFIFKLLGLTGGEAKPAERLPYQRKDALLSKAERSFFGVLQLAVGDKYLICVAVRLADVLAIPKRTENRQRHFNRISAKHVDFLLCDPATTKPLLGIELDDSSHARPKRQERDAFVDATFEAAGLPLLRVPARAT